MSGRPRCPFCGAELESDSLFCDNCGKKVGGSAAPGAQATASTLPPPPPPAPPVQQSNRPNTGTGPAAVQSGPAGKRILLPILILVVVLAVGAGVFLLRNRSGRPGTQGQPVSAETELSDESRNAPIEEESRQETVQTTETHQASDAASESSDGAAPGPSTGASSDASAGLTYDPVKYETTDDPTLADFQWVTSDILKGTVPEGALRLTNFEEICGGWKVYIIDDPFDEFDSHMERLCRSAIGEDSKGKGIGIRWGYAVDTSTGEGFDEKDEDSFFYGTWEDGCLDTLGTGSIKLTNFWYLEEHEYAAGTMMWPDGVTAAIFLVRP